MSSLASHLTLPVLSAGHARPVDARAVRPRGARADRDPRAEHGLHRDAEHRARAAARAASALGLLTGTLINVVAAAAGLSALIASGATAFDALRYLGAAYLVYLGIKALLSAASDGAAAPPGRSRCRGRTGRRSSSSCSTRRSRCSSSPSCRSSSTPSAARCAPQVLVLGAILGALGLRHGLRVRDRGRRPPRSASAASDTEPVTGAVYLALGAAAALTGGRR